MIKEKMKVLNLGEIFEVNGCIFQISRFDLKTGLKTTASIGCDFIKVNESQEEAKKREIQEQIFRLQCELASLKLMLNSEGETL